MTHGRIRACDMPNTMQVSVTQNLEAALTVHHLRNCDHAVFRRGRAAAEV